MVVVVVVVVDMIVLYYIHKKTMLESVCIARVLDKVSR